MCPKCKKHNTYDIIPEIPNLPHLQLSKDVFEQNYEMTIGNSKYYCLDCEYSWKKYRGKKVYDQIKVIHANSGGFPGLYFEIRIDLESMNNDRNDINTIDMNPSDTPIEEKINWSETSFINVIW
jgi:hypothetical protein